ncbi:FAD binding domain-containing protein [Streptomyces radicis]|uniref:FAD binding domain-containing protein n=1 Tax=Streptomyces radicis TaxID=1750517 RepID=UPI001C7CBE5E|nr:xanthine dehydrogenase family protein subunit M [Streptomyces radicis]
MREFAFARAATVDDAVAAPDGAMFLAGGTTLVDLMKLGVLRPRVVMDINALPLREITLDEAGLTVGAGARMSDLATHPDAVRAFPLVVQALLAGASQQIRNMASIGGNLMQRTRCGYYRDPGSACNRRDPGGGCAALDGANRTHAVLGTSPSCVATHPGDLAVALTALDATVRIAGRGGERDLPLAAFYRVPGGTPHIENALGPGELITAVHVPFADGHSAYVKVRDRASYEFALASAAVLLRVREGVIAAARVAVGGVATVPWRLPAVEAALTGLPATPGGFDGAAARAAEGARALAHNGYKIPLLRNTVLRAVEEALAR